MNHATLFYIYLQVMDAFNLSTVCFTLLIVSHLLNTHNVVSDRITWPLITREPNELDESFKSERNFERLV
jgi:hypothetical protein